MRRIHHRLTILCLAVLLSLAGLSWLLAWGGTAVQAQTTTQLNGINGPSDGDTVAGVVVITGTATHPDFLRYEMAFYQEFNPLAGWIVFAEGDQPVVDGTLAVWDTTIGRGANAPVFPDGTYRLRLRVVKNDYNYDEYFALNLLVSNDTPTPTPTTSPTPTLDPNATPTTTQNVSDPTGPQIGTPTPSLPLLPTLTPFPTPSPNATPIAAAGNPFATPEGEQAAGIAGQLAEVDTTPLRAAAAQGIRITLWAFGALALYLILRTILRRLWLLIVQRWG